MAAVRPADRYLFVSDLHLRPGVADRAPDTVYDQLLSDFLSAVREEEEGSPRRSCLVLLGDVFELTQPAVWQQVGVGSDPLRRLVVLAHDHALVVASLAAHLRGGWPVTVVPGNHDDALRRPAVQEKLRALLCSTVTSDTAELSFQPWILHVPGLLYAEHGHQYHDINASSALLDPGGESRHDLARVLHRYRARLARNPGVVLRGVATFRLALDLLVSATILSMPNGRGQRAGYRERVMGGYANGVLDEDTVRALDGLAEASPARTIRRLLRKAIRRAASRPEDDDYLLAAVRGVHQLLTSAGYRVRFYVFGHTHVAAERDLGPGVDGANAVYLNTGTWSDATRRGSPGSRPAPTYVDVLLGSGGVSGHVREWYGTEPLGRDSSPSRGAAPGDLVHRLAGPLRAPVAGTPGRGR
jgi:UDP-2,3-diacylglucosamine pyrophosphatase LpxH